MRAYPDFLGLKLTPADTAKLTALLAASGLTRSELVRILLRQTTVAAVRRLKAQGVKVT